MRTLVNATFTQNQNDANAKNAPALGVKVHAIVRCLSFLKPSRFCLSDIQSRMSHLKSVAPFWHLSFRPSLADTHSQNPRNDLLFLRFCSTCRRADTHRQIGSTKPDPNLSAKSVKLFLRDPYSLDVMASIG